ncbi:hypothetical protein EXU57_06820 [Segetibacter sp. 3557_3]|uniref:hypothetical protein n=1 Tax=Segetibacter sp. 3557_3 TaxID=2547429 RepID=UPI001058DA94|nr:hypothetical protein [Segetibacter sp. 3557_3]TDH27296.1 hypothetical protein EXU57_06820 [Segetibacter sp. 3557_3]
MKISKLLLVFSIVVLNVWIVKAQVTRVANKPVPKTWTGHWQKGNFSLSSFQDYNGKYIGPANETSVSYVINENGSAKEYFISNSVSYNCRMQILGFREGKLVVNAKDNSFEFQPSSGYYNMLSCMSKTATRKTYGEKDLYPAYVVRGSFQEVSGSLVLVTKNANSENGLTLRKIEQ